jgi:hypothetical protein
MYQATLQLYVYVYLCLDLPVVEKSLFRVSSSQFNLQFK